MNAAALQGWLKANPKAAAGAGAAALVGVVLLRRRSSAGSSTGAAATSTAAGGIALTPAGSTLATGSQLQGTADSSASDAYNALQPQLEALQNQLDTANASTASTIPVPPPVASTLFSPAGTGHYVQYSNGLLAEVESDGTQLGLNKSQWDNLRKQLGGGNYTVDKIGGKPPAGVYSVMQNLQRVSTTPATTAS